MINFKPMVAALAVVVLLTNNTYFPNKNQAMPPVPKNESVVAQTIQQGTPIETSNNTGLHTASAVSEVAVISNESVDEDSTQPTGSYSNILGSTFENNAENTQTLQDDTGATTDMTGNKRDAVLPLRAQNVGKQPFDIIKSKAMITTFAVGDRKSFWVANLSTNRYYQITATLKASGNYSNIWVYESDYTMSTTQANQMAAEVDNKIYSRITNAFGNPSDVDGNGKLNVLFFDIIDGLVPSQGYVAGYFDPNDLFQDSYSNYMELLYIDIYPLTSTYPNSISNAYDTIAHEFQHLINFNRNVLVESSHTEMDIWLNEGMSEAASQIYSGEVSQDRISFYNTSANIVKGQSLLRWTSTLENYSLSYLFVQYLKVQAGLGDSIFKMILNSPNNNYLAVEQIIKQYIDPNMSFGEFMTSFRAALYLNNPTGLYGFKGATGFNTIARRLYTGGSTSLYGGGAVVVQATAGDGKIVVPSNKGQSIVYLILNGIPTITGVEDGGIYNSDRTITFDRGTAKLNGVNFVSGTTVTAEGNHSLEVVYNDDTYTFNFLIDKTAPVVSGVANNVSYYSSVTITFNEGTATLNGVWFASGSTVSVANNYSLVVTDTAGNTTTVWFQIIIINSIPKAPTGLKMTTKSDSEIGIRWNLSGDAVSYDVYCDNQKVNTSVITQNTFTITGLTQNTEHTLFIRANNSYGQSPNSVNLVVTTYSSLANADVGFAVGDATANLGDIVSVTIKVQKNNGFLVAAGSLRYDSAALEYVSFTKKELCSSGEFFAENNASTGVLSFDFLSSGIIGSTGDFITIQFKIKQDCVGNEFGLFLDIEQLKGSNFNDKTTSVQQGAVHLFSGMIGDINNSSDITTVDALMVLQHVTGRIVLTELQKLSADVNNDGQITTLDALKILQYASGKISTF